MVKPRVSAEATRQILQEGVDKLGLLLQSITLWELSKSGMQGVVPILSGISPGFDACRSVLCLDGNSGRSRDLDHPLFQDSKKRDLEILLDTWY